MNIREFVNHLPEYEGGTLDLQHLFTGEEITIGIGKVFLENNRISVKASWVLSLKAGCLESTPELITRFYIGEIPMLEKVVERLPDKRATLISKDRKKFFWQPQRGQKPLTAEAYRGY